MHGSHMTVGKRRMAAEKKKNLCKLWHQDYHDAVYKYIAGAVNTCCTMCKSAGRAGRLPLELVYGL